MRSSELLVIVCLPQHVADAGHTMILRLMLYTRFESTPHTFISIVARVCLQSILIDS